MSFFHSLLYSQGSALPLAIDSSAEVFTAEAPDYFGFDDRRPNLPQEPGMVYDEVENETVIAVSRPWNTTYQGYAALWKYSSLYGAYPALIDIGEKQGDDDNHLTPSLFKGTAGWHVFQEDTHIGDLDRFLVPLDFSTSTKQAANSAGNFARVNIRRTGADTAIIHYQENDTDLYKLTFDGSSGYGTPTAIVTSTRRIYSYTPFGPSADVDGWYHIPLSILNAAGTLFNVNLLLKTQDWVTFYNIDESDSFEISGGAVALTTLIDPLDKWVYYGDYNEAAGENLTQAIGCVDSDGNFYAIKVVPGSNQFTLIYFSSGWQEVVYNYSGQVGDFAETALPDSNMTVTALFKRGTSLYSLIRVQDGAFYKIHLFKTSDLGVTWEDLGDVAEGVNVNIYRASVPLNINDIPSNTNFPICSSEYTYVGGPAAFSDVYIMRAAFGSLQALQPFTHTDKYNAMSEFPDLYLGYESDDVNISGGTTISSLNDKSGNARTATAIASPQLTSGEIVINGVDNGFQLNSLASTLNLITKVTIYFVGRNAGYFFSLSRTTDDNVFALARIINTGGQINFANAYRIDGVNTITVHGNGTYNGATEHLYTFQIDLRGSRWFIDGREQNKGFSLGGTGLANHGKWASMPSINRCGIGVLQRSSTVFTPLNFRALAYINRIHTTEERMMAENFLADKYGITLNR